MRNRLLRVLGAVGAGLLLAGCTVTVSGAAAPLPGQGPVKKVVDACTLLSQAEVTGLGFEYPGKPEKASEQTRSPAMCIYGVPEDSDKTGSMITGWAVDQTLDDYLSGALPKGGPSQVGGLSWQEYSSIDTGSCNLYTTLGPRSYAFVSVSITDHDTSCGLAKPAVPYVAARLPGGQAAPPPPSPSKTGAPTPSGPLASADPCASLKPDQIAQLKVLAPQGAPDKSSTNADQVYCEWKDTDGDRGQKALDVWYASATAASAWAEAAVQPTDQIDASGHKWGLYPNVSGDQVSCAAILPVTDTSSVMVISGFLDDPTKMCDLVKQAVPLVTANLPS